MFGGTNDENYDRSECHVMIVGDPGLGKSRLLKACANASPKGKLEILKVVLKFIKISFI